MKSSNEARFSRAKVEIMSCRELAYIGGLAAAMPITIREGLSTAATDGRRVFFGQEFLDRQSPRQLNYVLCHEYFHALLQHCKMMPGLHEQFDPKLVAMAADYVVNLIVEECALGGIVDRPVDPSPLYAKKYKGMSVLQVCKDLQQRCKGGAASGRGAGTGKGQAVLDEHESPVPSGSAGGAQAGQAGGPSDQEIARAIATGIARAKAMGVGSQEVLRDVKAQLNKKTSWRKYLEKQLTEALGSGDERCWSRPNRRMMAHGYYFPGAAMEAIDSVVLAIDTSGSIDDEMIAKCKGDMISLCNAFRVEELHIIYWDHGVARHELYANVEGESAVLESQAVGGGGTSFAPVLEYLKERGIVPKALVGWTDGYVFDWGDAPNFPAMWVMSTDAVPPWGKAIQLEGEM